MDNAILVTGGAGYIGSHAARRLLEDGREVVILDDLSTGHSEVVTLFSRVYGPEQFVFEEVDLLDPVGTASVFERHGIEGVIDFAAKCLVGESQEHPRAYFGTNVIGFRNLVIAAQGIPIVKSSTASTYGDPGSDGIPLTEGYHDEVLEKGGFAASRLMPASAGFEELITWYRETIGSENPELDLTDRDVSLLRVPTNVYGITKLMDELILAKVACEAGVRYVCLRYFNVAGADPSRLIGEDHEPETHLVPRVLEVALRIGEAVTIHGDDYETEDGTAVRDYVSINELVEGHVLCLDYLLAGGESRVFNLGTSSGYSVREILEAARGVTGREIPECVGPRRSGDPAVLVADATEIRRVLGWEARQPLEDTIELAWHWHRLNPEGYLVVQEERFNPFWDQWVNIAAHRASRPWRGETQDLAGEGEVGVSHDPQCYLCPGNRRAPGQFNPRYEGVWSFENDYPAFAKDGYEIDEQVGPYASRTSRGVCEVVNYSPDHSERLSTMALPEIVDVVDGWADAYARLGGEERVKYVLIFENRGEIMGNSQLHPHGQVYAYGEIPDLMVAPQIGHLGRYREAKGGECTVCDANQVEVDDGRRVLVSTGHFVGYVPFAARFPYDLVIAPGDHVGSLLEVGAGARADLARVLKDVLGGLDGLFGVPYHYSMALIQAPTDGVDYGFHMQVHITSLLRGPGLRKHVVGADIFGRIINPSDPNVTADEIRHAMEQSHAAGPAPTSGERR